MRMPRVDAIKSVSLSVCLVGKVLSSPRNADIRNAQGEWGANSLNSFHYFHSFALPRAVVPPLAHYKLKYSAQ